MRFEELRPLTAVLPADEAGLLAYARALAVWRARHALLRRVRRARRRRPRRALLQLHEPGLRPGVLSAHRSGHHRAGERRRAGAARPAGGLAAAALLDHRRLRRAGREPRGRGGARGRGGDRRGGHERALPLLAALAVPLLADARVPRDRAPRAASCGSSGELEDARWFTRAQITSGEALAPPSHSISWRLICGLARRDGRAERHVPPGARLAGASALPPGRRRQPRRVPRAPRRAAGASGPRRQTSSPAAICAPAAPGSALDRARRFGVVTNFRELQRPRPAAPSRGGLIPRYLAAAQARAAVLRAARARSAAAYSGFNLLLERRRVALVRLEPRRAVCAPAAARRLRAFERAARHAVAEADARRRRGFEELARATRGGTAAGLFALLDDRTQAATRTPRADRRAAAGVAPGAVGALRAATRRTVRAARPSCCSNPGGALHLVERRFDSAGDAGRRN